MHPRVNNIMHGESNLSEKSPRDNLPTCVIIVKMRIEELLQDCRGTYSDSGRVPPSELKSEKIAGIKGPSNTDCITHPVDKQILGLAFVSGLRSLLAPL